MLALNIAKGNIAKGIAEIWANIIMRLEKHFRKWRILSCGLRNILENMYYE